VDRRHQPIFNSIIVFQYFTDRCQTVGRAGSIGHNGHIFRITGMVDSHDECRCFFIFCRCRNNDFFCTTLQVSTCLFCRAKCSGCIDDVFGTAGTPRDGSSITFCEDRNLLPVNDKSVFISSKFSLETSKCRVVADHIDHIIKIRISCVNST